MAGLKLTDEERIERSLKRSCKTDSLSAIDVISEMIIDCPLKETGEDRAYEDNSGKKYKIVISENDKSPKYNVRLKRLEEEV